MTSTAIHGQSSFSFYPKQECLYKPGAVKVLYRYTEVVHGQLVTITRYETPAYVTYNPAWDHIKNTGCLEVYK